MPESNAKFTGLYWPAPPYACYADPVPWVDPLICELEDVKGTLHHVKLALFKPLEQMVTLFVPQRSMPVRVQFNQFRRLTIKTLVQPQLDTQAKGATVSKILGSGTATNYRVQWNSTQTDEVTTGKTVGNIETSFGMFLFHPMDAGGAVERVFIPRIAYQQLTFGDQIGKVLVDENLATPAQVEQAASQQQDMRNRKLGDYLVSEAIVMPDQLMQALDQQSKMPMIRVGEALLRLGYIDQAQLDAALEKQKTDRSVPLGQLLLTMGVVTQRDLNTALARKMGYPVVDASHFPIEANALAKIPLSMAQRLGIMPLVRRGNTLVIATVDPTRRKVLEELEFLLQLRVVAVLSDAEQIAKAQRDVYAKYGHSDKAIAPEIIAIEAKESADSNSATTNQLLETLEQDVANSAENEKPIEQSDNSLVRLVNQMIMEARAQGVSDIHIETHPAPYKTRIRFRKDGLLSPYLELPHTYKSALLARLKIMADLDISEKRKPQDGKIDFSHFMTGKKLELRIATIPTTGGLEDVVMRLLSSAKPIPMVQLGLSDSNFKHLCEAVSRPYGMVLCVGPTGSGKTTTLHSLLDYLNTPQRKIWTAEDPIEITQPDLRQVQVNPKIDWTFAKALRSFLRADPDVIMVGEIRDQETAQIAIEASLTGHLVLSTLHTNSAAETVTRLIDMGMDPFNFADSLLAVLAQRLVRRLCTDCKQSEVASPEFITELIEDYLHAIPPDLRPDPDSLQAQWVEEYAGIDGKLLRYSSPGCPQCQGRGLRGRIELHELLLVSPTVRRLVQTTARSMEIQTEAIRDGNLRTLRQDGICKVLMGQTTIEEVRANSNNV